MIKLHPHIIGYVVSQLNHLEARPLMWAYTKEAFAVQLCSLMDLYEVDQKTTVTFYRSLFELRGPAVLGLTNPATEEWCAMAVQRAREVLEIPEE